MAKLIRQTDNSWKFETIGEPIKSKNIKETVKEIKDRFL